jgi:hypothetical protein
MLDVAYPRDLVMIGVVFGVAAFVWAGWAQEKPPAHWGWRVVLGALGIAGLALAGLSIPVAVRNWRTPTAIDPASGGFRVYLIIVAVEVVVAAVLAIIVSRRRRSDLIAPLILGVVGVHFFALAVVFGQPVLHLAAVLITAVAIVAALRRSSAARSFWCGLLAAPIFLAIGTWCAVVGAGVLAGR